MWNCRHWVLKRWQHPGPLSKFGTPSSKVDMPLAGSHRKMQARVPKPLNSVTPSFLKKMQGERVCVCGFINSVQTRCIVKSALARGVHSGKTRGSLMMMTRMGGPRFKELGGNSLSKWQNAIRAQVVTLHIFFANTSSRMCAYIYICLFFFFNLFAVTLKTGPRFGGFKVFNWSKLKVNNWSKFSLFWKCFGGIFKK